MSKRHRPLCRTRNSERNRSAERKIQFESLELRRVLANAAGDLSQLPGDSNADGVFDQRDLVAVFQAGKYETDRVATWAEGDWNGDGRFNSEDLVLTMQLGTYNAAPNPIAAEMGEPAEDQGENKLQSFAAMMSNRIRERAEAMRDAFFERMEEEGADLDGLKEAIENRDFDAIRELMAGFNNEDEGDENETNDQEENEGSLVERLFGRIGERAESLREKFANAEPPEGMNTEALQKLRDAVESGDRELIQVAWKEMSEEQVERHREKFRDKIEEWKSKGRPDADRVEERITAVREALANGKFEGLDEAALAQVNEALDQGDLKGAMTVIREQLRGKNKPEEGEDTRVDRRIAWGIKHIEAAVESGRIDAEGGQQLIAALEANDFEAYRELWRNLLKSRDEKPEEPNEDPPVDEVDPPANDELPRGIQMQIDAIRAGMEKGRIPSEIGERMIAGLESANARGGFAGMGQGERGDEGPARWRGFGRRG